MHGGGFDLREETGSGVSQQWVGLFEGSENRFQLQGGVDARKGKGDLYTPGLAGREGAVVGLGGLSLW